ncbi:hypothetical protein KQH82_05750 [bacterium]|nr:hypothetical protein [bacterium]
MAIDREKIIGDLSRLYISGDENGLIPAYGVLLQQMPASFWNNFTSRILTTAPDELTEAAEMLLENAAAECGYYTGYGIVQSEEFKAVVMPMVEERPADILRGLYGVFGAWGWADAEVVELEPARRMVVHARHYYEAKTPNISRPCAYMVRGVSRAFMDLAYGGPYPNGLGRFRCQQTMGIEVGDPYGEFVVTPQ